ncbi:MAG TPA: AAA family ATPase [Chthonomonadaceae bacterium]|nr:AAA family ATPase [Chthonomonadaceae bacterium]
MEGKRLLRSLSLKNILSFGPEGVDIELQPLNVLIGPNGSGKSNFLEVIRLLQATPRDLTAPISRGGGIHEWLWKGGTDEAHAEIKVDAVMEPNLHVRHMLAFGAINERLWIHDETVHNLRRVRNESPLLIYGTEEGIPYIHVSHPKEKKEPLNPATRNFTQSILAQRDLPHSTFISFLQIQYSQIRLYSRVYFGQDNPARQAQPADMETDFLREDSSNLALILSDLRNRRSFKRILLDNLQIFNPRIEDFGVRVAFGMALTILEESGLENAIPATRLSDGTLRFLSLLAVLCHPEPPPLVCIEEPELGMHPDIIPAIAELLIEASHRTQLIITTHSDMLVSKMYDVPEAIIVCEREDRGTTMRRLTPQELEGWPEHYTLGDIWLKGAIGGVRW